MSKKIDCFEKAGFPLAVHSGDDGNAIGEMEGLREEVTETGDGKSMEEQRDHQRI